MRVVVSGNSTHFLPECRSAIRVVSSREFIDSVRGRGERVEPTDDEGAR